MEFKTLNKKVLETYEQAVNDHDISDETILKSLAALTALTMSEMGAKSVTVDERLTLTFQEQIQIPAFLLEMSQQMHQQDNRITAEPIWQVRCKRYLVTQEGYNDHHWEIFDGEDGDYSTLYRSDDGDKSNLAEWLLEHDAEWCKTWLFENDKIESYHDGIESFADVFTQAFIEDFDVYSDYYDLPSNLTKLHFQEIEEVIKSCLTEADANWFIRRKQHDYPHLYTYVASMYLCPQMIELRNWILSLTQAKVKA